MFTVEFIEDRMKELTAIFEAITTDIRKMEETIKLKNMELSQLKGSYNECSIFLSKIKESDIIPEEIEDVETDSKAT